MSEYEKYSLVISCVSAVIALGALFYAGFQLRGLKEQTERSAEANLLSAESNNFAALMAVLELENSVASARVRVSEGAARLSSVDRDADPKAFEFATLIYQEAVEQYLNATDRLCSCIIRGFVDEETYRKDYRFWFAEIVKAYASSFGADTRHPNILKVHQAWQDDRPVCPKPPKQRTVA